MKFERNERKLLMSPESLVAFALPRYAMKEKVPPQRLAQTEEIGEKRSFSLDLSLGELSCSMRGECALLVKEEKTVLLLSFATEEMPRELSRDTKAYVRGVGFVILHALSLAQTVMCIEMRNFLTGEVFSWEETPAKADLLRFWSKLVLALSVDENREIERITRRYPSLLAVPFPYSRAREGQKDMMSGVYTAIKRGETLFATAPTGTGKTMAVLFPALRALAGGYAEKIFYLTPKTTSAAAAVDACLLLFSRGADLRALHLLAKERLCNGRSLRGSCYGCEKRKGAKTKEREALRTLLAARHPVVTSRELIATAAEHGVCPHALAVSYASYADIVIGDYNYLFDSAVAPPSLFAQKRRYAFLIDEAHNLPDRAREMYSDCLTGDDMEHLLSLFSDSARLREIVEKVKKSYLAAVDDILRTELHEDAEGTLVGFAALSRFPEHLERALSSLADVLRGELRPTGKAEDARSLEQREAVGKLCEFLRRLEVYDNRFTTYATREAERRELHFFCLDPSELVCAALDKGSAAVFFSATLEPLDYYRTVLCGGRRTVKIEVPSPFDLGALCVGIMDKVSVRAKEREETLSEVVRIIITAMKARRGNYMVFCPSYDYMEQVAKAFSNLTPKTPIAVQKRQMSQKERKEFLDKFKPSPTGYFVGFCVSGGIFSEGIDLVGDRLIGTVVLGASLPVVSAERELISSYYQDKCEEGKEYAYLYPGINRVMQAAGRVIRTEDDRGVAILVDDRLRDAAYRRVFPQSWRHLKYAGDRAALSALVTHFWETVDMENDSKS